MLHQAFDSLAEINRHLQRAAQEITDLKVEVSTLRSEREGLKKEVAASRDFFRGVESVRLDLQQAPGVELPSYLSGACVGGRARGELQVTLSGDFLKLNSWLSTAQTFLR